MTLVNALQFLYRLGTFPVLKLNPCSIPYFVRYYSVSNPKQLIALRLMQSRKLIGSA